MKNSLNPITLIPIDNQMSPDVEQLINDLPQSIIDSLTRPIPVGETRECADREYIIHIDGSWRRTDGKRQQKGKTWRNNRAKAV